jgi:hypothetical protein
MGEPHFRSLGIKNFMGISPERSRACPSAKPLETPTARAENQKLIPAGKQMQFFSFCE